MKGTGEKRKLLFLLPVITLFCFGLWFLGSYYLQVTLGYENLRSDTGLWDLTEFDFESGFVRLYGHGETIQNRLVPPEDFDSYQNEIRYGGGDENPVNTTRMRVLLPDDGFYMAAGHSADYAETIFIGGEERQRAGTVGETAETSEAGYAYFELDVRAENGVLDIVRQTNNFVHREGGNATVLFIGRPELMRRYTAMNSGLQALTMGIFLALFIGHGALYVLLHRYKANLYFALLCLGWCIRTGVTGRKLIVEWFPDLPWQLTFRTEYFLTVFAVVCILLINREIFPGLLPKGYVRFYMVFTLVFLLVCILLPSYQLSYTGLVTPVFYIAGVLLFLFYLCRYLPRRIREGRLLPEQRAIVFSLLVLFFVMVHDMLYYNNLLSFSAMNNFGVMLYALVQIVAIYCGTMRQVEEARAAERESRLENETLLRVGQLKEAFLHNLSHELQMPITVMSGFAQLTTQMLTDDAIDLPGIQDNMRRVEDEAGRMERLVSMLLDAAAIDSGSFTLHREKMDFGELIRSVAEIHFPIMDGGGNRILLEAEDALTVNGDWERLQQVLINLLSNAVKHTKNGTITIKAQKDRGFVKTAVKDTGEGISPELLPELFGRFKKHETTGGSGLGLYICRQLAEAHGGMIEIESQQGRGTTVTFTVPLWKEEG